MSEICFAHMPFARLGHPSMALSVLAGECRQHGIDALVLYGSLKLAKCCSLKNYLEFVQYMPCFTLIGELLFKPYAGYKDDYSADDYFEYARLQMKNSGQSDSLLNEAVSAYRKLEPAAEAFLEEFCDEIIATGCKAVGCDITYEQRNASLALLKKIKEKSPEIVTMLGGNTCTGESGQALADYAEYVDYVFCGEADDIIVPVWEMIKRGENPEDINKAFPSVLIKGSKAVAHARNLLEENAFPDFSGYFEELKKYGFDKNIKPCLLIEGSRGCWWGQIKRCSFCGISTSEETLHYREKTPARIAAELKKQSETYGIKAFVFTDCILSTEHVNKLPSYLEGDDFRLFAEVKSNLTSTQMCELKKAGFVSLQPGIEALQDDLLKLMNKGNRAIKHIELLKYGRTYGISLVWNLLFGMPFEKELYYKKTEEILHLLTHLQPPVHLSKVIFQRDSCYTRHSGEYGLELEVIEPYKFIGDFGVDYISRMAGYYKEKSGLFDYSQSMYSVLNDIQQKLMDWTEAFAGGQGDRLTMFDEGSTLEIIDLRKYAVHSVYRLTDTVRKIYLEAGTAVSIAKLKERFGWQQTELGLKYLTERRLIVQIEDEVLALATPQPSMAYRIEELLPIGKVSLGADNYADR